MSKLSSSELTTLLGKRLRGVQCVCGPAVGAVAWVLFDASGNIWTADADFGGLILAGTSPMPVANFNGENSSALVWTGRRWFLADTTDYNIWMSEDLAVWRKVLTTPSYPPAKIVHDGSENVYVANTSQTIYKSVAGGDFFPVFSGPSYLFPIKNMMFKNGRLMYMPWNSPSRILSSTDGGISFSLLTTVGGVASSDFIFDGSSYIAAGAYGAGIKTSPDLVTWTSQSSRDIYNIIRTASGLYVAYDQFSAFVSKSTDLVTWTNTSLGYSYGTSSNRLNANGSQIGFFGDSFVHSSDDGATWSAVTHPSGKTFVSGFPKIVDTDLRAT